jgi:Fur family peroxide stress response transcriptional regulator
MQTETLLRDFPSRCRALGLAVTHQRSVIYRELLASGEHPTPEVVYERVRSEIPSISLGTVYKNIRIFLDSGLLREVSLHHGTQRLDANTEPHHHLVCTVCRKIFDIPESDLEPVQWKKNPKAGFKIERYSIELHGVCGECAGR